VAPRLLDRLRDVFKEDPGAFIASGVPLGDALRIEATGIVVVCRAAVGLAMRSLVESDTLLKRARLIHFAGDVLAITASSTLLATLAKIIPKTEAVLAGVITLLASIATLASKYIAFGTEREMVSRNANLAEATRQLCEIELKLLANLQSQIWSPKERSQVELLVKDCHRIVRQVHDDARALGCNQVANEMLTAISNCIPAIPNFTPTVVSIDGQKLVAVESDRPAPAQPS
jgi:hypothetical protein